MRKKIFLPLVMLVLALHFLPAHAQTKIEYPEGFATDMDLDGLTDEGERQIYNTDPANSDTDGDGYFDGLEVLNGTDPLDASSRLDVKASRENFEPAWPWYATRITAIVAFILLYIVIFLGLSIRLPILKKIIHPDKSFKIHAWLSVQALIFSLAHGASLLFDKFLHFDFVSVFIPFASTYETEMVSLGTLAFYGMLLLILSSYFRRMIPHRLWRISHFLNVPLYVIVVVHAMTLGTDIGKQGMARDIFIYANALLIFLFFLNLTYQLIDFAKKKLAERQGIIKET